MTSSLIGAFVICSYRNSLQEQKMQMLLLWQRRRQGRVTPEQLMRHLVHIQQTQLAEELAEMLHIPLDEVTTAEELREAKAKVFGKPVKPKQKQQQRQRGNVSKDEVATIEETEDVSSKRRQQKQSGTSSRSRRSETRHRDVSSRSDNGYSSGSRDSDSASRRSTKTPDGSHRSSGAKSGGKNRPQLKIPNQDLPEVEIIKYDISKRNSKHSNKSMSHDFEIQNGGDSEHQGQLTRARAQFGSVDSDLIVSEGGSDLAEVSDEESLDEVATSTVLDCGSRPNSDSDGEGFSSPDSEPNTPDGMLQQTVPKSLEEPYTLEHVRA